MRRSRRSASVLAPAQVALLATLLGLPALVACAGGGASHPEPVWMRPGASEADLAADREACAEQAMASGEMRNDRREAEVRATRFMKCMRERGWTLGLPEDADTGAGPAGP